MLDWNDPFERGVILFLGGMLALCAIIFIGLVIGGSITKGYEKLCLDAGYPDADYARGQWYCIGIRDGSSVAVPVGEVGR